jgi:antibiotic biosynthesis monooxygenase (ABM) superfamily enzyme
MPHTNAFDVAKNVLAATLLSLAILEHWFMVLPLSSTALWKWAMRNRRKPEATSAGPLGPVELATLPLKTAD